MEEIKTPLSVAKPEMGLCDSANGKSILAYKIVDASHLCKDGRVCVIKYGEAERGRIAQINHWYESYRDMGSSVHYFIAEMTPDQLALDSVFERQAYVMQADPHELSKFIFENQ